MEISTGVAAGMPIPTPHQAIRDLHAPAARMTAGETRHHPPCSAGLKKSMRREG